MGYGIDGFKQLWGEDVLEVVASLIVGAGALVVLWEGTKIWARSSALEIGSIGLGLALYAAGTFTARYPQERLHYLGYGLLSILLYIGFARDRVSGSSTPTTLHTVLVPALAAVAAGSAVGMADELLQILWPRRYFDWADVAMNVVAVSGGLLVAVPLWSALRRDDPSSSTPTRP
jgi:hypothetical protein